MPVCAGDEGGEVAAGWIWLSLGSPPCGEERPQALSNPRAASGSHPGGTGGTHQEARLVGVVLPIFFEGVRQGNECFQHLEAIQGGAAEAGRARRAGRRRAGAGEPLVMLGSRGSADGPCSVRGEGPRPRRAPAWGWGRRAQREAGRAGREKSRLRPTSEFLGPSRGSGSQKGREER